MKGLGTVVVLVAALVIAMLIVIAVTSDDGPDCDAKCRHDRIEQQVP